VVLPKGEELEAAALFRFCARHGSTEKKACAAQSECEPACCGRTDAGVASAGCLTRLAFVFIDETGLVLPLRSGGDRRVTDSMP
jgi:hypothetical protein